MDERSSAIFGRIIDAQTQKPIEGVRVQLHDHPSLHATTDILGGFHIRASHNIHLISFLGMCGSDFPEGKTYSAELDILHPAYQSLKINARAYLKATNITYLELRDIPLYPISK